MCCLTGTTSAELGMKKVAYAGQIGLVLELKSSAGLGNAHHYDHFLIVWKLTSKGPKSIMTFIDALLNTGCP